MSSLNQAFFSLLFWLTELLLLEYSNQEFPPIIIRENSFSQLISTENHDHITDIWEYTQVFFNSYI